MLPSTPSRRSQTGQDGFRGPFLASMGMLHGDELASRLSHSPSLPSSLSAQSNIVSRNVSTSYLPPDLLQIQSLLSSGQLPNVRIVNMEVASSHVHYVRRLHLSNDSMLHLAVAPPPNVHLLRHERYALETEALVLSLLRPLGLPVASVVRHDASDKLLGAPFLLTTALPGVPLSRVILSGTAPQGPQRLALETHLRRLVNAVSVQSSLMFGPAPLVATGKGYDTWQEAFRAMLADAVKDAEDAFVHLPYGQIWQAFEKARDAFDEIQDPKLVVPGLGKANNVLIEVMPNGSARISGLQGFQGAFWGDSEMGPIMDGAPEGQLSEVDTALFVRDGRRRKILLYKIYKQIIAVATAAYRPRTSELQELEARKELTSCLAKLDALDGR